jgi:hypothetical protein
MAFHRFVLTVSTDSILFKDTDTPDTLDTRGLDRDDLFEIGRAIGGALEVIRIEHVVADCGACNGEEE